ncbi:MAG: exlusion protein FxsA [Alphaproteobacteria bacterium]|nr:exlusion protein FxsA [Alphaproteobacteria bacterium]
MILLLLALFVIGPIAEIYVLLAAGQAIGVWPVVGLCIATAVLGGILLRIQGLHALTALQRDLHEGRVPVEAVADGVFLAIAAPLLMTPGFLTDALGFALMVPPLRHWIARQALKRLRRRIETGETRIRFHRF